MTEKRVQRRSAASAGRPDGAEARSHSTGADRALAAAVEPVLVPIAVGELFDKITILAIKSERIVDPPKLQNIEAELRLLLEVRDRLRPGPEIAALTASLKEVNERLWAIEDDIRDCERRQDFGPRFVELARAVYRTNDRRAELKRRINQLSGSGIVEEKSYRRY